MNKEINRGLAFEDFIFKLLKNINNSFNITRNFKIEYERESYEIDFLIQNENISYIIEVKSIRSNNYPISALNRTLERLEITANSFKNKITSKEVRKILIASNNIPELYTSNDHILSSLNHTEIIDRNQILFLLQDNEELLKEFQKFIDSSYLNLNHDYFENHYYLNEKRFFNLLIQSIKKPSTSYKNKGSTLCHKLQQIKMGRNYAYDYEDHIKKIIEYLFDSNLDTPKKQVKSSDNINRYDLISRIKLENLGFWKFIQDRLNCQYIIFECKNYSKTITQGEILTTEKYLLPKALRSVSIIFSRKGANKNAIKFAEGALRENGKLIIVIDDDVVCHMLKRKDSGDDPSDVLFDLADEFFMSLNR